MWWLIPIAAVGLYSYFTSEKTSKEKKSFERWENRRKNQLEKIERLRLAIENKVKQDKLNNDFIMLTELHFNSFLVSNETYKLLDDAKVVLDYFNKMRIKTIGELFKLIDKAFNDHKMDSKTIYLYFYTHLTWYKITMKDFINISESDVLNYYKEF